MAVPAGLRLIARMQDSDADLRARIAAGEALGMLGDPRWERKTGQHGDYLLPPLVSIADGEYPIGDDESNNDFEKPAHTVELEPFQIGAFPVTNAEYALFMAAGGYEQEQWWATDEARAWLRGEGSTEGQKQSWREFRQRILGWSEESIRNATNFTSQQKTDYFTLRRWSDERFEEWLDESFPSGKIYRQPEYWPCCIAQLFGSDVAFLTSSFAQVGEVRATVASSPHASALLRIALPP